MLIETLFTLVAVFKPVHVMDTQELSCGAAGRLMKEKVKIEATWDKLRINGMPWQVYDLPDDWENEMWHAKFQVRPDQYTFLNIDWTHEGAWLTLESIDVKRRPCKDKIYLKRIGRR